MVADETSREYISLLVEKTKALGRLKTHFPLLIV